MNIKLSDGLYIVTQDEMIAEQKAWGEKNAAKNHDFTRHDYFLRMDDVDNLIHLIQGFNDVREIIEFIDLVE